MTHSTFLNAAHLLQQRSTNFIGVMTEDDTFMYRLDPEEIMKDSDKTTLPLGVYFDEKQSAWSGYSHAHELIAQCFEEIPLGDLRIMEIKERFSFWEVLTFMRSQEPGSIHKFMYGKSTLTREWNGNFLVDLNGTPLDISAYEKLEFHWEHPIVQNKDVTTTALNLLK